MSIFRIVIEAKICGEVRFVEQARGTGPIPNPLCGRRNAIYSTLGVRRYAPLIEEGVMAAPRLLSTRILPMACGLLVELPLLAGGPTAGQDRLDNRPQS